MTSRRPVPIAALAVAILLVLVVLIAVTGIESWHGWGWRFWDPLVAIGTLALAAATIYLARETAAEIAESRRVRRQDLERARIERVYEAVVDLVAVALRRVKTPRTEPVELEVAQQRLKAAIAIAGGGARWGSADLMTRDFAADAIAHQGGSALIEIAEALDALEGNG